MRERTRPPTHPGGILLRQYLEPLGIGIGQAAATLGVSRQSLSKILHEQRSMTPDMALRLAQALHTTPELWLNLAADLRLVARGAAVWGLASGAGACHRDIDDLLERLLDMPRSAPVPASPGPRPSVTLEAPQGERRRRMVALLQEHPEGLSPVQTQQLLGLEKSLGSTRRST